MAQNIQLFGPREGFLTHQWILTGKSSRARWKSLSPETLSPRRRSRYTNLQSGDNRRSWRPGRSSRYNHHKLQNGDRSRQDKRDDKQPKRLPKRDRDERLESWKVENFKYMYLEAIFSNEGSKPEILSRIAQTIAALSGLKIVWRDKNISLASKVKLMRMLIISIFLYACEIWTLTVDVERRIQALRWDAIRDFETFPTKTMWRTRRFATECMECMVISQPW